MRCRSLHFAVTNSWQCCTRHGAEELAWPLQGRVSRLADDELAADRHHWYRTWERELRVCMAFNSLFACHSDDISAVISTPCSRSTSCSLKGLSILIAFCRSHGEIMCNLSSPHLLRNIFSHPLVSAKQVGSTALVFHPRYLFGALQPSPYAPYKENTSRYQFAYKAMSKMVVTNSLVKIKAAPPYTPELKVPSS